MHGDRKVCSLQCDRRVCSLHGNPPSHGDPINGNQRVSLSPMHSDRLHSDRLSPIMHSDPNQSKGVMRKGVSLYNEWRSHGDRRVSLSLCTAMAMEGCALSNCTAIEGCALSNERRSLSPMMHGDPINGNQRVRVSLHSDPINDAWRSKGVSRPLSHDAGWSHQRS
jgi:hypothetical protein